MAVDELEAATGAGGPDGSAWRCELDWGGVRIQAGWRAAGLSSGAAAAGSSTTCSPS